MTKTQKILAWIFGAMFVVPEVLFFNIISSIISIINNLSAPNIKPLIYYFVNPQFFTGHIIFYFAIMCIEWLGVLGLFVLSIKTKKTIFTVLSGIMVLWLIFVIWISYALVHFNPIM